MQNKTNTPEPSHYDDKLVHLIKSYFKYDQRIIRCIVILICSVLRARTVNLEELALASAEPLNVKQESLVRRFQRFFGMAVLSVGRIGALVLGLLQCENVVIAIDRTNWKFGCKHINLLIAGVIYHNVCIPVAWSVLPASTKRGNSKTLHRKRLINQTLDLIPAERIEALVGDREFVGAKWISYLHEKNVAFVLRIRCTLAVDGISAKEAIRRHLLTPAKRKNRRFRVCGVDVYIAIKTLRRKKQADGSRKAEKLILISNVHKKEKDMFNFYKQRESIEHLFSHWKKRGFNFESTHMKEGKKLEQWVGILTLCVAISMLWGVKKAQEKAIKKKGHGFRAKSLFRHGLDGIRRLLMHTRTCAEEWRSFFDFIFNRLKQAFLLT